MPRKAVTPQTLDTSSQQSSDSARTTHQPSIAVDTVIQPRFEFQVDGLPTENGDRIKASLLRFLKKHRLKASVCNLQLDQKGSSTGSALLEFDSLEDCDRAKQLLHDHVWDQNHTLKVHVLRLESARSRSDQEPKQRQVQIQTPVVSKPLDEISTWPLKVTELYLGRKNIDVLQDLEQLPNLTVLWLNGNRLKSFQGADANFRLKKLYLHDNQLETLQGSLKHLIHLEVLLLHNNRLADLQHIIEHITHLQDLKHLNIFGNPFPETEQQYRSRLISLFPKLEVLDRLCEKLVSIEADSIIPGVRQEERLGLPVMDGKMKTRNTSGAKMNTKSKQTLPKVEQDLLKEVKRIKDEQERQQKEEEAARLRKKQMSRSDTLPMPVALDFLNNREQALKVLASVQPSTA